MQHIGAFVQSSLHLDSCISTWIPGLPAAITGREEREIQASEEAWILRESVREMPQEMKNIFLWNGLIRPGRLAPLDCVRCRQPTRRVKAMEGGGARFFTRSFHIPSAGAAGRCQGACPAGTRRTDSGLMASERIRRACRGVGQRVRQQMSVQMREQAGAAPVAAEAHLEVQEQIRALTPQPQPAKYVGVGSGVMAAGALAAGMFAAADPGLAYAVAGGGASLSALALTCLLYTSPSPRDRG